METNRKYLIYKDSGVEWLGKIPESWEVKKLKFIGFVFPGLSGKKGEDFSKEYSTGMKPYIPFINICNNQKISSSNYHFVKIQRGEIQPKVFKNDLLFLMSSETYEDIAKCSIYLGSDHELYLNSFCKGFRITNNNLFPEYANYLFQGGSFRSYFSLAGRGFTRINLKQEYIKNAPCLIPPLPEQKAIAKFLDKKTALIDKAIQIKEKQIALLQERRQILIQQAVTRGLDPTIKMKDSGVDWIGMIPEHWEVKRLKNLIADLESGVSVNASESESADKNEIGVLKTSCVYTYNFVGLENKKVFKSDLSRVKCPVKTGRIIISRMNAPELVGASGYVHEDHPNLFLPDRLWQTVFSNLVTFKPIWLSYILVSNGFRNCITAIANGSSPSMKNISKGDFLNLRIPFPPFNEQTRIAIFIEETTSKTQNSISLKEKEIEKLKEYKATLINSAVTGKIKVV